MAYLYPNKINNMSKFHYDEAAAEVVKIIDITFESFREIAPDYLMN